jgi:DMSO reductase family type II enzyme heme b subunit
MKDMKRVCLALAAAAGVSLAGPAFVGLQGAAAAEGTIKVVQVRNGSLADPAAKAWKSVPQARIEVATAPPAHPSIVGAATTTELKVQAAKSGGDLFIRIQWKDPSANRESGIGRFADAVAVQFAADGSDGTSPLMGGEGRRVNIWYWNASNKAAENLVANGFGTLARAPVQDVKASGAYADGTWTVVFRRAVKPQGDDNVPLVVKDGTKLPVAFSVWNGSNAERDGFKAVTPQWQWLAF